MNLFTDFILKSIIWTNTLTSPNFTDYIQYVSYTVKYMTRLAYQNKIIWNWYVPPDFLK